MTFAVQARASDGKAGGALDNKTAPQFEGFFNNWGNGSSVKGWIFLSKTASDDQTITVEAQLNDAVIGRDSVKVSPPERRCTFTFDCTERFRPVDIVTGRLRLFATSDVDGQRIGVPAHAQLLTWMAKVAFNESIFQYIRDPESAKFILEQLEGRFGPSLLSGRSVETPEQPPKDVAGDVTALLHRVGTISQDRSAILGRDGTIFLYEGSNKLFSQYQETALTTVGETLVAQWQKILTGRVDYFRDIDVPFVQTIIPEKTSALCDLFPLAIKTPTPLLAAIEAWAAETKLRTYVSMYDHFRAAPDVNSFYLKTDSHFSVRGAIAAARLLLEGVAAQRPKAAQVTAALDAFLQRARSAAIPSRLVTGDLAGRFFGVPLYEEDLDIRENTLFGEKPGAVLVKEVPPPAGNHTGLRMVWRNPDAPLDLRVMAFGNSFFERGGNSTTLSWWMKHLCREFHFVWSKEIDRTYIEEIKPDAVICQTIERFLTTVPMA